MFLDVGVFTTVEEHYLITLVLDDSVRRIVCIIGNMMDPGLKTIKDTAPESFIEVNAV